MEYKIYKITNKLNGLFYVGRTKQDFDRYWGSGKLIKQSVAKNGKKSFLKEILQECETLQESKDLEREWIKRLQANVPGIGYNLSEGGEDGEWWELYQDKEARSQRSSVQNKESWARDYDKRKLAIQEALNDPDRKEYIAEKRLRNSAIGRANRTTEQKETSSRKRKLFWSNLTIEQRKSISIRRSESWTEERRQQTSERQQKFWTEDKKKERSEKYKGIRTSPLDSGKRMNEVKWSKEEEHIKASERNRERWSDPQYKVNISEKNSKTMKDRYEGSEGERLKQLQSERSSNRPRTICPYCNKSFQICRLPGHIKKFHNEK